ncbi:MAG: TRAM domain-containing protein, partial [Candidatus Caenarcaniphilales bacterium]|nr:TRAM domain-containing protein [Candidatus Caenarcaniphilales bacterium]
GIFTYSKEEDSYSATLDGHIDQEVKERRKNELALVQQESLEQHMQKYVGKTLRVLVEGHHPDSEYLLQGRFYGQCPEIDGVVIINDWRHVKQIGEFYDVKITEVAGYDLVGRVLAPKHIKPRLSLV